MITIALCISANDKLQKARQILEKTKLLSWNAGEKQFLVADDILLVLKMCK